MLPIVHQIVLVPCMFRSGIRHLELAKCPKDLHGHCYRNTVITIQHNQTTALNRKTGPKLTSSSASRTAPEVRYPFSCPSYAGVRKPLGNIVGPVVPALRLLGVIAFASSNIPMVDALGLLGLRR